MTKKDYELIAKAIRDVIKSDPRRDDVTAELLILSLSDKLRSTNPAFDPARFVAACYPNTYNGKD